MVSDWLALNVGNSRLHWAWFKHSEIRATWKTRHFDAEAVRSLIADRFQSTRSSISLSNDSLPAWTEPELWIASVVPDQLRLWQSYSNVHIIELAQIPLKGLYITLGIDRALALWGAIERYGAPVLVIDCGTAMTFTGANQNCEFAGGAILPGVRLQFEALGQKTAALPTIKQIAALPSRWTANTIDAIASGILHTLLSGIEGFVQDWNRAGRSTIVMTGGDAVLIYGLFQQLNPAFAELLTLDLEIGFWGMRSIRLSCA